LELERLRERPMIGEPLPPQPASLFPGIVPLAQSLGQGPSGAPQDPPATEGLGSVIESMKLRRDQVLMTNFAIAVKADPELAGEAQRLGIETGLDPSLIERNIDVVRDLAKQKRFEETGFDDLPPALRAQLEADPHFARIAHDDIEELSFLEEAAGGLLLLTPLPIIFDIPLADEVARSMLDRGEVGELQVGAKQNILPAMGAQRHLTSEERANVDRFQQRMAELPQESPGIFSGLAYVVGQMLGNANEIANSALGGATGGAVGGSVVPGLGTVGGAMLGGGTALAGAIATTTADVEASLLYLDLIDAGVDPATASWAAAAHGTFAGALEVGGIFFQTRAVAPIVRDAVKRGVTEAVKRQTSTKAAVEFIKNVGISVAGETGTEVGQFLSEQGFSRMVGGDPGPFWEGVGTTITETIKSTLILGSIAPAVRYTSDLGKASRALEAQKRLAPVVDAAAASKTRPRNPPAFQNHLDEVFQQTGLDPDEVREVYIEARQMQQTLDEAGVTARELDEAIPGLAQQLQDALESSGDVVIPMAQYVARLADHKLDQVLRQDIRFEPEGASQREAEAFQQTQPEASETVAVEVEKTLDARQEFAQSARRVEQAMLTQLRETRRMTEQDAQSAAFLYRQSVETHAAREGISPEEWHAAKGIKEVVRGEGTGAVQGFQQVGEITPEVEAFLVDELKVTTSDSQLVLPSAMLRDPSVLADLGGRAVNRRTRENLGLGGTKGFEALKQSIAEEGLQKAVSINIDDEGRITVVDGTHRLLALEELGENTVRVELVPNALDKLSELRDALQSFQASRPELGQLFSATAQVLNQTAAPELTQVAGLESSRELATSKAWGRIVNFKQALQERVRAAAKRAGINLIDKKGNIERVAESAEDHMVLVGVADAIAALRENPNAVGWYSERVLQALNVMGELHPEILTDEDAKFAFVWITAVTSNGLEVSDNFRLAQSIYATYKATGVMPNDRGTGKSADAMNTSLELFNTLIDKWGPERFRRVMLTRATVQEIQDGTGYEVSGENVDAPAIGAGILGAKIGNGFFANLNGLFDMLTMDRWLVRSWGRWSGLLIYDRPDLVAKGRARLRAAIDSLSRKARTQIENLVALEVTRKDGVTRLRTLKFDVDLSAHPDAIAAAIAKWSEKPVARVALNAVKGGEEVRRAGNSLFANLTPQKEDPANGAERDYIRRVFTRILETVRAEEKQWADLDMADLQAALWFAEKRLYDASKAKADLGTAGQTGYIDEEAPDYANAAVTVAKENDIDGQATDKALRAGQSAARRAATSRRRAGILDAKARANREGGLTPSQRKVQFGGFVIQRARANRADAGAASWSLRRSHRGGSRESGLLKSLGVKVRAVFKAGQLLANRLKTLGVGTQEVFELDPADPRSAAKFHSSISAFKNHPNIRKRRDAAAVFVHDQDSYAQMRLFLTASGKSGVAVTPDGEIVSVFSAEGNGRMMVETAIANGGTHADAFDTVLPHLYAGHGLRVVARTPWDESQKPKGWNKKHFKDYNGGRPDVVFLVYDPAFMGFYDKTQGTTGTFEQGVAAQQRAVSEVAASDVAARAPPAQQQAFAQEGQGRVTRGSYDPVNARITLFEEASFDTWVHELSHHHLNILGQLAAAPEASEQIREDFQTLLDWFGIEGGPAAWNAMSLEEQRPHHDAFARNFELWMATGRAPSQALEGIFARFRRWMVQAYKHIRDKLNADYKAEFGVDLPILTGEVRQVMERMVASQEAIEQKAAVDGLEGIFEDQESSGMSDAAWAAYQDREERSLEEAVAQVTRDSLAAMRETLEKRRVEERKGVRAQATEDVGKLPVHRARRFLREGELVDEHGQAVEWPEGETHKMDTEAARILLPPDTDLNAIKGMTAKDGMPPDLVASMFDYGSGDALIRDLVTAPSLREAVSRETDRRMLEERGEFGTPEGLDDAVEAALANDDRARMVAIEIKALTRSTQPARLFIAAAKQNARRRLAAMPVKDIRPHLFAAAKARAARATLEAMKKGDTRAAIENKRAEMLQGELEREARKVQQDVNRAGKTIAHFRKTDKRLAKTRDLDFIQAGRALLQSVQAMPAPNAQQVGRQRRAMARAREDFETLFQRMGSVMGDVSGQKLTELPLQEFRDVVELLDAFNTLSRSEFVVDALGRKMTKDALVLEGVAAVQNAPERKTAKALGAVLKTPESPPQWRRTILGLWHLQASLKRFQHVAKFMDRGELNGFFQDVIERPVMEAVDNYRRFYRKFMTPIITQLTELEKKHRDIWDARLASQEDELGGATFRGLKQLLGLLMHSGTVSSLEHKMLPGLELFVNATRRERGLEPIAITPEGLQKFLDRMVAENKLPEDAARWVESAWRAFAEILPMAQQAHLEMFGREFPILETRNVELPFGTLEGGYAPARVDWMMATATPDFAKLQTLVELEHDFLYSVNPSATQMRPGVDKGFTIERNPRFHQPLVTDVARLLQGVDAELRFTFIQPVIKEVLSVLDSRELKGALFAYDRNMRSDVIDPFLEAAARQQVGRPGPWPAADMVARFLTSATSLSIFAYNVRTALIQRTGIFAANVQVKRKYMRAANRMMRRHPHTSVRVAMEKDPETFGERITNQMRLMRRDLERMTEEKWARRRSAVVDVTGHYGFWMIRFIQGRVDTITWHGAYQQFYAEAERGRLTDEEFERAAVREATQAVERAQGSMTPEGAAGFQIRGTPLQAVFTQISNYGNTVVNAILGAQPGWARLRAFGWLLIVVPVVEHTIRLILQGIPEDDDHDGLVDDLASEYALNIGRNIGGSVPFFGPSLVSLFSADADRIGATPAAGTLKAFAQGAMALAEWIGEGETPTTWEARNIGVFATVLTGLPLSQAAASIGYAIEVSEGDVDPTGPLDLIRGLLTGKPSPGSR
jgi:hypothetical protein